MNQIQDFYVYEYTFLDDLSYVQPIENYQNITGIKDYKNEFKKLFIEHGWEGDGELGVIWLPPFIGVGAEDTFGHYIIHVKQSNNGTSFLASDEPLPFARLISQNNSLEKIPLENERIKAYSSQNDYEQINIIGSEVEFFKETLISYKNSIGLELNLIEALPEDQLNKELSEKILGYNQCMIVQHLNDFIDRCYLQVLLEVLNNGNNSNVKLSRSSVKIDLGTHYNIEDEMKNNSWLTINMIISDIWRSYKFESFKEKLIKLFKPLEYNLSNSSKNNILKHVTIRNCIQHHNWQLDPSSVKSNLGTDFIIVKKSSNNELRIEKWKTIELSKIEIIYFIEELLEFADHFSNYVSKRITTRYRTKKLITQINT